MLTLALSLSLVTLLCQESRADLGLLGPLPMSFLPRPRLVVLGQQGVGKSSISNALMGFDNTAKNKRKRKQSPFKVGHGLKSKTQMTTFSVGQWLGGKSYHGLYDNITIVDTPGFKDTRDSQFVEELTSVLGDEVPSVDSFLVVFKYKDRFTGPFKRTLTMISKMLGDIWNNVVVVVTFWDYAEEKRAARKLEGMDEAKYTDQLQKIFKKQIGALNSKVPVVFLDSHFTKDDSMEVAFFQTEAQKLRQEVMKMKPFACLKRTDIQKKLKKNKSKLAKMKRKENKRRRDLEAQVRNLTDSSMASRSLIEFYSEKCPQYRPGCKWGTWSSWSKCNNGNQERTRARLVGELGAACEGESVELKSGCTDGSDMSDNWVEHQDTVTMVLGGRGSDSSILADTQVISNITGCSAPMFPYSGELMSGAYSWGSGLLVCGGRKGDGRPLIDCMAYQANNQWTRSSNLPTGIWGAASGWLGGKFWMVGGSSSSGSSSFSINKDAHVYDPVTASWSTEPVDTKQAVIGGCMVTVDSLLGVGEEALVLTGGTKRNIDLDKRNHGIRATSTLTLSDANWQKLPNMKNGRSFHGCAVSTIEGSTGIVVGGGSADGDSVEFLSLDDRKHWVKIGSLGRQRIYGAALSHVAGRLSMIGGYSWPSTVGEIEQLEAVWEHQEEEEDGQEEGWMLDTKNSADRAFHLAVTLPASLLPTCQGELNFDGKIIL